MLDPDKNPRVFLSVLVAAGLFIFNPKVANSDDAIKSAKEFVKKLEEEFGKL